MKKHIFGLLMGLAVLSSVSCSPKENKKAMEVLKGKEGVFAVLETEKGTIVLDLYYKQTPMTVMNFVGLAEGKFDAAKGKPFYDGLKFHRVINDFMIQGGDPKGNGTGGPGYKFPDEFVDGMIFDKPGKLAMANSGANTNGSQFFITHVPTEWLNYKHTIFGEVLEGQKVVDTVAQGDTIKSLKIIRQGAEAEKFEATQAAFDKMISDIAKAKEEAEKKQFEDAISGCEKSADGIYFKVLKKGNGKKVGSGKHIYTEYKGTLIDGSAFDASTEFGGGHPAIDFETGAGRMIPGFDLMAQEMEYDETRYMVLPPEMGYGVYGYPGVIPGNAYITFTVHVLNK